MQQAYDISDAVLFQRSFHPALHNVIRRLRLRRGAPVTIMDIDDNNFAVSSFNPAYANHWLSEVKTLVKESGMV